MERNLTAHEPHPPLPCLCKACLPNAPEHASSDGLSFHRVEAHGAGRVLYAWVPDELQDEEMRLKSALEQQLKARFKSKYEVAPTPEKSGSGEGFFKRLGRFFGLS